MFWQHFDHKAYATSSLPGLPERKDEHRDLAGRQDFYALDDGLHRQQAQYEKDREWMRKYQLIDIFDFLAISQ
jgi:hypothetical protein